MAKDINILAINPGSTSTKLAIYKNNELFAESSLSYSPEELSEYPEIMDQIPLRMKSVEDFLKQHEPESRELSAVVGRGGVLVPVKSGAYLVNERMLERLKNRPLGRHASNLGAVLAYRVAQDQKIPAYVYDGVSVDELPDFARVTGLKDISRASRCHALNMRAAAIKTAQKFGRSYYDMNIIVVHLGGGITMSCHDHGRMSEVILDTEGPFSPERAGRIPSNQLLYFAMDQGYDCKTLFKELRGKGGLVSLFGTNDARKVTPLIETGDPYAILVWDAMAYQIGKAVGELYVALRGKADCIVITGGLAYSKELTDRIMPWIEFLAPVVLMPGENELESLAQGAYRVLTGTETAREYDEETDRWPK